MSINQVKQEERQLDQALSTDPLLVNSMQAEDQIRRSRRVKLSMVVVLLAIVATGGGVFLSQSILASTSENAANEGWKLWQQRKLVEAEEKFLEATELEPKSVSAWNGLGWAQVNQGKNLDALSAFKKCLELQPNMPAALNGAGQALLAQGQLKEAKEYLTKAAPQANAAWYGLARIALLEGNFEEAEQWSRKVYNLDPSNNIAKKMLAAAEKKELPADLKALIEPPQAAHASAIEAWQFFNRGNMAEAKSLFQKVLDENPEELSAMNGLAFCLLNLGEHQKAKPLFEKCLAKQQNAFGPMNGLARCLKAEGDIEGAIQIWKEMEETLGNVSAATSGLAFTHLEQGHFAEAKTYFEKLLTVAPQNEQYKSGLAAAELGLKGSK